MHPNTCKKQKLEINTLKLISQVDTQRYSKLFAAINKVIKKHIKTRSPTHCESAK
jgi:hypothetical protein